MVVVGTNANIDGFFIGNLLGDDGLAAINIAWPIVAIISSLGTGIGVGGAVLLNRTRGEGDDRRAEQIKNTTILLLLAAGILSGLLFYLFCDPLLSLMGASGKVLIHASAYSKVISAGAVFQVAGAGLLVLLRNDRKTYQSMIYSLVGFGGHILLNVLLAERFLMGGVAAATVLSQALIVALGFFSIKIDRAARPALCHAPSILLNASAPFGINFVPSFVLLFTNAAALKEGGVAAVSAYACMSYAIYTFDYIFQGVCDGIQPIISYSRGAADLSEERRALRCGGLILGILSVCSIALTPLLIRFLPGLLGVSGDAENMIAAAFWIYAASYPFKAAVKFICSYYYAIEKKGISNLLVYLDPLCLTPLSLLLLSAALGIDGVWLSMPLVQLLLTLIGVGVVLLVRHRAASQK